MTKTLYQALMEAGIQVDSHESDLYFKVSNASLAILSRPEYAQAKRISQLFVSELDASVWLEVPFAFDPWWELRSGRPRGGQGVI